VETDRPAARKTERRDGNSRHQTTKPRPSETRAVRSTRLLKFLATGPVRTPDRNADPSLQTSPFRSPPPTAGVNLAMPPTADSTRFRFGKNWEDFLSKVDRDRVEAAAAGLERLLGADTNLAGRNFVDIGCGSGLVSLAAHLAGAQVTSFDFDEQSVRCTETLRERCEPRGTVDPGTAPGPPWRILRGSILDQNFISGLGRFDIAYAWGVLHHTGRMWPAIEAACDMVAPGGRLVLAIYHDQGGPSRRWAQVKRFYHRLPPSLRPAYVASIAAGWELRFSLARLCSGRNPLPLEDWRAKKRDRGMSVWHDWVDWIGGWPFEVSSPDGIVNPLIRAGFELRMLKTVGGGWGCNEYVFRRSA